MKVLISTTIKAKDLVNLIREIRANTDGILLILQKEVDKRPKRDLTYTLTFKVSK